MFNGRALGTTLRRALHEPHPFKERIDPEFPVAMRCEKCGRVCYGPRKHMAEAMREHQNSDCPMRHAHADEPQLMRIFYPKC